MTIPPSMCWYLIDQTRSLQILWSVLSLVQSCTDCVILIENHDWLHNSPLLNIPGPLLPRPLSEVVGLEVVDVEVVGVTLNIVLMITGYNCTLSLVFTNWCWSESPPFIMSDWYWHAPFYSQTLSCRFRLAVRNTILILFLISLWYLWLGWVIIIK